MGTIFASLLFLCLKISILLFVVSRNASFYKKVFLHVTAALYVLYQGHNMLRRARRLRHAADRIRRAAATGGDAGDRLARRTAQRRATAPQGTNAAHRPAIPAGGANATPNVNVDANTTIAVNSGGPTRNAEEDPFAPPPPLYAPVRFRATSSYSAQWWLEQVAYAGMAREDMQLGLLPPRPRAVANARATTAADGNRSLLQIIFPFAFEGQETRQHPHSSLGPLDFLPTFLLALLLFLGTLLPEIEQLRRRAIEERESFIRVAARKEQERKEKREEIEKNRREQAEKEAREKEAKEEGEDAGNSSQTEREGNRDQPFASTSKPTTASSQATNSTGQPEVPSGPSVLTSEYGERILRGANRSGGIRSGAELDLEAEHEAARRADAGEAQEADATDNTDTDGAEAEEQDENEADGAEEEMGFF